MLLASLILGQTTTSSVMMSDLMLMGVKVMFLIGFAIYFIFSIVVIRQIKIMKNTLITSFSPVIQLIGFVHFLIVCLAGALIWSIL